jgi:pyruvate dehydrogenase E2 component (dihydrolipoamide acetyltransferase)
VQTWDLAVTEFRLPNLGENVATGDVTKVLIKIGDVISAEQSVLELETDKATVEVPSSVAGRVTSVDVKPGDKVTVGQLVLTVDGDRAEQKADGSGTALSSSSQPAPANSDATDQRTASADAAPSDSPGATATVEAGDKRQRRRGEVVSMTRPARTGKETPRGVAQTTSHDKAAPASPSVRRLAREVGVDIDQVQGTGPDGRISPEDVKEYARRTLSSMGASRGPASSPSSPLPDFRTWGEVERKPMTNIRRKTAQHLAHAWNVVAHVTQCDKADITQLEELRTKFREKVKEAGGNLTMTSVLVKVLAAAVGQFPQFNASIDVESNEMILKKYVNVGVAVDTEWGLLVPVIRDADKKGITQIAVELQQLSEKARARKLTLEEMSGGSISISNLGGIGGTYFTPIVNWPEVAILGVSRGVTEPVWRNGTFEPRQLLPLSLSYDHRAIDGADGMRFLRWVVEAVEQPFLLSLVS